MANDHPGESVPIGKGNGAPEPLTHLPAPAQRPAPPRPAPTQGK